MTLEVKDCRKDRELKIALKSLIFAHPKRAKGEGEYPISNNSDCPAF